MPQSNQNLNILPASEQTPCIWTFEDRMVQIAAL